jgi:copper chaperone CopZ
VASPAGTVNSKEATKVVRRNFIRRITAAGAGGLATIGIATAGEKQMVTYRVKGFSCVTCAVGLETMLRGKKGVTRAQASYPKAMVVIEYDASVIAEASLKGFITEMGFSAEVDKKRGTA